MSQFNIEFAQKLSEISEKVVKEGLFYEEEKRAVLYISLVSCEIALKAALEKSGKKVSDIRKHSHDLSSLLQEVCNCTIMREITQNKTRRVRATNIRAVVIDYNYANCTIGNLLDARKKGASKFPNEIRYSEIVQHYPAPVMAKLSKKIVEWVKSHWADIQA